jgi:hypothetical protein
MSNNAVGFVLGGLLLALGVGIAGIQVGDGLQKLRSSDRYVVVKGLAEREVPADLVVWPITFSETGNDLGEIYDRIQANAGLIAAFLADNGLGGAEASMSPPRVQDFLADGYRQEQPNNRYRAEVTYTVRSDEVMVVKAAMERSGELIRSGVAFTPWGAPTQFFFTALNDIKPELLAEATAQARIAAEQFARDSDSEVGGIRTANQGVISIGDRDANTPDIKRVRVVTTVEYILRD